MSIKFVKRVRRRAFFAAVGLSLAACACATADAAGKAQVEGSGLSSVCTPDVTSSVASSIASGVTIKQIPNGPQLPGGVKLTPAAGKVPAYCQVTGSYVTNPKTAKTANFIATFPEKWNGKYLQLGCSGACGYLLMNDPASPPIIITAQGYPGQLIEKGYATFGNDLGHVADSPASMSSEWMKSPDGAINEDALTDYFYRADRVMADMGKAFTRAFYARQSGTRQEISKSYFMGCSQGGREALIAATRFPEQFDGIIAGSPASDLGGIIWTGMAHAGLAQQAGLAKLTPGQIAMLKDRVLAKCDALDGVKDNLIQNPMACEFHPTRDLPICDEGHASDTCVTKAQAEVISTFFSGVTDDAGRMLQPGFAVDEPNENWVSPIPAGVPLDADERFIIGKEFDGKSLSKTQLDGSGNIDSFHIVLNGAAYQKYSNIMREGTILPADFAKTLKWSGKLLWYHNLSDETLTPYMSINRYKSVAESNGGYATVQKTIRLYTLPGTNHCGMSGTAPTNFDAIGALENWVEDGVAPDALPARQNDPAIANAIMGTIDWSKPPVRTMPLCKFPEMASYKGGGDMKDAANWECRSTDTRMLKVGVSGREAGVVE
jgi:feruloyl esterase